MILYYWIENEFVWYREYRIPFAELVGHAEKQGQLLLLTTKLIFEELSLKYGERVMDRLKSISHHIVSKGNSMRRRTELDGTYVI